MSSPKSLIIVLIILGVGIGGYFIWNSYLVQKNTPITTLLPSIKPMVNKVLSPEDRDNQRIADLSTISKALDDYATANAGQYPKTNGKEKISDENTPAFSILKKNNYLKQQLKDPLSPKYYYGYKSDGVSYELTAVLENNNDTKCTLSGNLCIYKIEKGEISINKKETQTPTQTTSTFVCGTTNVKDIANNIYNTVQIGSQCWLKQNLKVTKNPAGEAITRYCYNNDPKICDTDGGLYDWNTAMNNSTQDGAQGICPSGWHVPKDSEWYELENGLATGTCTSTRNESAPWKWECDPAGTKLKPGGSSGFESVSAGVHYPADNSFNYRGTSAIFWSSTKVDTSELDTSVWNREVRFDQSTVGRSDGVSLVAISLRCLKD